MAVTLARLRAVYEHDHEGASSTAAKPGCVLVERLIKSLDDPDVLERWKAVGITPEDFVGLIRGLAPPEEPIDEGGDQPAVTVSIPELFESIRHLKVMGSRDLETVLLRRGLERVEALLELATRTSRTPRSSPDLANPGLGTSAGALALAVSRLVQEQSSCLKSSPAQVAASALVVSLGNGTPAMALRSSEMQRAGSISSAGGEDDFPWEDVFQQAEMSQLQEKLRQAGIKQNMGSQAVQADTSIERPKEPPESTKHNLFLAGTVPLDEPA